MSIENETCYIVTLRGRRGYLCEVTIVVAGEMDEAAAMEIAGLMFPELHAQSGRRIIHRRLQPDDVPG